MGRTLLAGSLLDLVGGTDADQAVVRLELLQGLGGVVDQSEAGALATTVLCAEPEDGDLVLVGLVQVGQLLTELILGDVGAVGVEDVPGKTEMSAARSLIRVVHSPFLVSFRACRVWCRVGVEFVVCQSFDSSSKLSSTGVKRRGELTRPSACGQAEGCG